MPTAAPCSAASDKVRRALDYRPNEGVFRVAREIFTDPAIFDLEMEHLFEKRWVFACHESQIPAPGDYFTVRIGRQPLIVTRDRQGAIHAMANACLHRGATLVRLRKGNAPVFSCPYHAWTYRNDGTLMGVKEPEGYDQPIVPGQRCLPRARVAAYRGFVFVNLDRESTLPLEEFLGEARRLIDLVVEQSPTGELEVVPGHAVYTYDGNWKLQMENGVDGYHVTTVHASWIAALKNRWTIEADSAPGSTPDRLDASRLSEIPEGATGWFAFRHGHSVLFTEVPNPTARPGYQTVFPRLQSRHGQDFAYWAMCKARNLNLYPSMFLIDQISTQIRVVRPLAWNRTEIHSFCLGVKGEAAGEREKRIRQFEDFFNVAGMGTPDDLVEFREAQQGFEARLEPWNDISRGWQRWTTDLTAPAQALGVRPELIGTEWSQEGVFVNQHRHWQQALMEGLGQRPAGPARRQSARR